MQFKYEVCGFANGDWNVCGHYFYENIDPNMLIFFANTLNTEKAIVIDLETGEVIYLKES